MILESPHKSHSTQPVCVCFWGGGGRNGCLCMQVCKVCVWLWMYRKIITNKEIKWKKNITWIWNHACSQTLYLENISSSRHCHFWMIKFVKASKYREVINANYQWHRQGRNKIYSHWTPQVLEAKTCLVISTWTGDIKF